MMLRVKDDGKAYVSADLHEQQLHYVNSAITSSGNWDILFRTESGELKHLPSKFLEVVTKLDVALK